MMIDNPSNRIHRPPIIISEHARTRSQQRGISLEVIDILYKFGSREWSDGELAFSLDGKARRRMDKAVGPQLAAEMAEQASGCYIVVSADEPVVITVARQLRRKKR